MPPDSEWAAREADPQAPIPPTMSRRGFLALSGAGLMMAAGGCGLTHSANGARTPPPRRSWDPLARQTVEPDTTFLLDPAGDAAAHLAPATGGLLDYVGDATTNAAMLVAGKYREGIQPSGSVPVPAQSYKWMPCDGILGVGEFTFELWARCATDWTKAAAGSLVSLGEYLNSVSVDVQPTSLAVTFQHQQNRATPGNYQVVVSHPITAGQLAGGAWVNVAATLKRGVLTLYLNGTQVGQAAGVVSPAIWGCTSVSDGVQLPAGSHGAALGFTVSDLRISRRARVPNVVHLSTPNTNLVTVQSKPVSGPTGTVQRLCGALEGFTIGAASYSAIPAQSAQHGVQVIRGDKFLTATPIKAGGTDHDHPTAGHSGQYSYDWQVVDRTLRYWVTSLGCEPYITLDSVPQILGGKVAPFTGAALRTELAAKSEYAPGPPSSATAFATMCADLVHHVTVDLGFPIPYCGLWNEPDVNFDVCWETGPTAIPDYLALYAAVVPAIKAVAPTIKVGGPEVAGWLTGRTWIQQLIAYCGAHSLELDFVSWHWYSGDLGEFSQVAAQVAAWAAAAKIDTPALIVGEGSWAGGSREKPPWQQPSPPVDYVRNDWSAAVMAASLMQMQQVGVVRYITIDPNLAYGENLFDTHGTAQAPYNVMRMWSMMGPTVLETVADLDPGVHCLASTDHAGDLYVLLASLHYRNDKTQPVTVTLPSGFDGAPVTAYLVDNAHSNAFDTHGAHPSLETVPAAAVDGDKVEIVLPARAAALLHIPSPRK